MVGSLFSREWVAELDRLQHNLQRVRSASGNVSRNAPGLTAAGFPAFNMRSTPQSVDLFAMAPGLDPASIDVQLDGGVLTVSGQRVTGAPGDESGEPNAQPRAALRINERFSGAFRRTVGLPDNVDPDGVTADYRDGVLHIAVKRKEAVRARRVAVTA